MHYFIFALSKAFGIQTSRVFLVGRYIGWGNLGSAGSVQPSRLGTVWKGLLLNVTPKVVFARVNLCWILLHIASVHLPRLSTSFKTSKNFEKTIRKNKTLSGLFNGTEGTRSSWSTSFCLEATCTTTWSAVELERCLDFAFQRSPLSFGGVLFLKKMCILWFFVCFFHFFPFCLKTDLKTVLESYGFCGGSKFVAKDLKLPILFLVSRGIDRPYRRMRTASFVPSTVKSARSCILEHRNATQCYGKRIVQQALGCHSSHLFRSISWVTATQVCDYYPVALEVRIVFSLRPSWKIWH